MHNLRYNRPCSFRAMIQVPRLEYNPCLATPIWINFMPLIIQTRLFVPPALTLESSCTVAETWTLEIAWSAVATVEVTAVVLDLFEAGLQMVEQLLKMFVGVWNECGVSGYGGVCC